MVTSSFPEKYIEVYFKIYNLAIPVTPLVLLASLAFGMTATAQIVVQDGFDSGVISERLANDLEVDSPRSKLQRRA